jgi:hypothetical protein
LNGAKRLNGWNVWNWLSNYIVPGIAKKILGRAEAFGRVVPEHFSFDFIAQGVPRQHLVG